MASVHTDITKAGTPAVFKSQGLNLSLSTMEAYNGVLNENDKTSVLSPCVDQTRKKMFRITSSVKMGESGTGNHNGDVGTDNDADSVDGLDETEEFSSDVYDNSKATDLDIDLQECLNVPLTPDEVTSTTTIVVRQRPDQNSQSRFKVVKIETKEPFRRGKWICYDFYDTGPGSVVTVEKNDSKITDNASSSSYVHDIQDVNDSSSKIFNSTIVHVSPVRGDGQSVHSDVFVPIQPAPANEILNQLSGLSSDVMAPFIAQQVIMSVAAGPSSSNSFHNLAQSGHSTIIQSLPHTNNFPYGQNGHPIDFFQNGVPIGQSSEGMNVPSDFLVGNGASNIMATAVNTDSNGSVVNNGAFTFVGGLPLPCSISQTQIRTDAVVSQGISPVAENSLSSTAGIAHVPQYKTEAAVGSNLPNEDQKFPHVTESADSIETLQGDADAHPSASLKEAVETVGDIYMGLEGTDDDPDDRTNEIASLFSGHHMERPRTLPFHPDRHNMESPFGFCLTPVRSVCASPVPLSFMEHYDPLVSMSGLFPVRVATPTLPIMVSSPSHRFTEPVYNTPAIPLPVSFPHAESFMTNTNWPTQKSLVFSSGSAFVPQGMSETRVAPTSMHMSIGKQSAAPVAMSHSKSLPQSISSMSQNLHGMSQSFQPQGMSSLTSLTDREPQLMSFSHSNPYCQMSSLRSFSPMSSFYYMDDSTEDTQHDMISENVAGRAHVGHITAYSEHNVDHMLEACNNSAPLSTNRSSPEDARYVLACPG